MPGTRHHFASARTARIRQPKGRGRRALRKPDASFLGCSEFEFEAGAKRATPSSPAKAGDPVFQSRERWNRSRSGLDTPHARGMTAFCGATPRITLSVIPANAGIHNRRC
jgi:hypothetical protein